MSHLLSVWQLQTDSLKRSGSNFDELNVCAGGSG